MPTEEDIITTVGELKAALAVYPDSQPIQIGFSDSAIVLKELINGKLVVTRHSDTISLDEDRVLAIFSENDAASLDSIIEEDDEDIDQDFSIYADTDEDDDMDKPARRKRRGFIHYKESKEDEEEDFDKEEEELE